MRSIFIIGLSLFIFGCSSDSDASITSQQTCENENGVWKLCGDANIDLPGCPAGTYTCFSN